MIASGNDGTNDRLDRYEEISFTQLVTASGLHRGASFRSSCATARSFRAIRKPALGIRDALDLRGAQGLAPAPRASISIHTA